MMASRREAENTRFIHGLGVKRMRICWNSIISEEKEGDILQRFSSTSEQPYTNWLTLGIGPWRQDGSGSSKGKATAAEKKSDSGSTGLYTNWLTLKTGSCTEDGSSKCIHAMEKVESSTLRISSCREDGSNKKLEGREESIFKGYVPEDILNIIFCQLPLHTLFQVQIVSTSWQSLISSSAYFHNLWEQNNMQMWLIMDLYDETSGSSNGVALYDVNRTLRYKKVFNDDEWRCSNSEWFLRAGDGGLLIYSCKRKGTLRVINPLTMQSHCLEDARLTRKSKISCYMKKYHDDVAVKLKFDPKEKSYEVIVVVGNLYLLRRKKFVVLIYRSGSQRWDIRDAHIEERLPGQMTVRFFSSILIKNQKMYLFSENGADGGMYNLNGDSNTKSLYIWGTVGVSQPLGIVMYKGRIIRVCKREPMVFPAYTDTLIFSELDEPSGHWISEYESIVLPKILFPGVICVGGDYIWVIQKTEGYVSLIICIDIDSGELNIWPEAYSFIFDVRSCVSMPLSFCPCS
ncbi:hypothetical protein SUGI_1035150 [Cryptomeria japonica]|nr:hypothetical protein SUGI_1035150 [Cryptomeria japonica]